MKKFIAFMVLSFVMMGFAACSRAEKFYTVTYRNGEEIFATEQVAAGEVVDLWKKEFEEGTPQRPEDEEWTYEFKGWGYREAGEAQKSVRINEDTTFYALFEKKSKAEEMTYTVTFYVTTDDGEQVFSTQKVKVGERALPPSELPARTGYTFTGWDRDLQTPITERTEIHAVYEKSSYTLYLHVLRDVREETVEYETPLPLTAPAHSEGFLFEGWYADGQFTSEAELDKMPASDVHLYAKFSLDFSEARLSVPQAPVYGEENRVSVTGLKQVEGLNYSYEWQDGSREESCLLSSAGEHEISVKVTGDYGELLHNETTLLESVTVSKRPLTATIELAQSLEYGEAPAPHLTLSGLVPGDENIGADAVYTYYDSEGESAEFPLAAGQYTVTATLAPLSNYELEEIGQVSLEVTKRTLRIAVSAEDIVYGNSPSPELQYDGFLEGEDESVLLRPGQPFGYRKGEEIFAGERFSAGEYEIFVVAEAFEAKNYEIEAGPALPFRVEKAPMEITLTMERTELIYGERPDVQITHSPFVYSDETEESVFGAPLTAVYSGGGEQFPVGSETAASNWTEDTENYSVTSNSVTFMVTPRPLQATLASSTSVFGEEIVLPAPIIEGVVAGEESLLEELKGAIVVKMKRGEEKIPADRFLDAGEYTLVMELEGEFPNYEVTLNEGTWTIQKRAYEINSGKVSQNRSRDWTYEPHFSGEEGELFEIQGQLALNTRDVGTYTLEDTGTLSGSEFEWRLPLKITLKDGRDVTENFEISYSLHVTLNNSHFNVTVPSSGLSFVYDGKERVFEVQVTADAGEEAQFTPTLRYQINGEWADRPVVKNAGTYEIECEISAENYERETRNYTVVVNRAKYTLSGETRSREGAYNGAAQGEEPILQGVGEEDVGEYFSLSVKYTSPLQEDSKTGGWIEPVNAGTYEISYAATGNPNYEDLSGAYVIKINRIAYEVEAEDQTYTYSPNKTFGKGITVSTLGAGNSYTVAYSYGGNTFAQAPTFSSATEPVRINYTVSEGVNYEENTGSYTVTVNKAQGILNLSGIQMKYQYNGAEQRIESGAVSNNREDGEITYENNVFRTVAEGNSLVLTVRLSEGKNYTGDSRTLTGFTVEKQSFSKLPEEKPVLSEQSNRMGKTLSEVTLPDHFRWRDGEEALRRGTHEYGAIYNPDSENCNDFSLTISFVTQKERIAATLLGGEGDFGGSDFALARYQLTGEGERALQEGDEELRFIRLTTEGSVDEAKGGTYPISCTLTAEENEYFELTGETEKVVPFKLKSVEVDGVLYTIEDALNRLESGMAIVKHDSAFLSEEQRSRLSESPYEGESYHTIKSGAALLVPYSEEDSGSTEQNGKQTQSAVAGSGYVTLFVPGRRELIVEGKLIVNALRSSDGQRTSMVVGKNYGNLSLEEEGRVRVKEGGIFESMGFTFGEGEVIAESGAQVFEPFAMVGWKGGAISAAIRNEVFPLNQYALSSLVAKTRFLSGSEYKLRASVSATLSIMGEQNLDLAVSFLGTEESAFLELKQGEILKYVDEGSGKIIFETSGEFTFHNLTMSLSDTIQFDTSGLQVPLPGNVQITMKSSSKASVPENVALKLLPGAKTVVEEGAEFKILSGGAVYGYGKGNVSYGEGMEKWQDGGNNLAYPHAMLSQAYRTPVADFGYTVSTPSELIVRGKFTVSSGGTLAAELTEEGSGLVIVEEGATLSGTIREDKTPALSGLMDKLNALSGRGGVYFEVTLQAYKNGEILSIAAAAK